MLKERLTDIEMMSSKQENDKFGIFNQAWKDAHLGNFSSSEMFNLMGEKGIGKIGLSYIYRKVGELVTGIAAKDDITTVATVWGNEQEHHAVQKFMEINGLKWVITQKLLKVPGKRECSTPDVIVVHSEGIYDEDNCKIQDYIGKEFYDVTPVEVKCPYTYDAYLRLFLCNNALDVRKEYPAYYFQILDQMDICDSLKGKLFIYQPLFKNGSYKEIDFRIMEKIGLQYPLMDDLKMLRERKIEASKRFYEIYELLLKN